MAVHGDLVAWALCAGFGGDPEAGSGWRGGLQAAADCSGQHAEILQIADDIYLHAHELRLPASVAGYAEATRVSSTNILVHRFLGGVLHHLEVHRSVFDDQDDRAV